MNTSISNKLVLTINLLVLSNFVFALKGSQDGYRSNTIVAGSIPVKLGSEMEISFSIVDCSNLDALINNYYEKPQAKIIKSKTGKFNISLSIDHPIYINIKAPFDSSKVHIVDRIYDYTDAGNMFGNYYSGYYSTYGILVEPGDSIFLNLTKVPGYYHISFSGKGSDKLKCVQEIINKTAEFDFPLRTSNRNRFSLSDSINKMILNVIKEYDKQISSSAKTIIKAHYIPMLGNNTLKSNVYSAKAEEYFNRINNFDNYVNYYSINLRDSSLIYCPYFIDKALKRYVWSKYIKQSKGYDKIDMESSLFNKGYFEAILNYLPQSGIRERILAQYIMFTLKMHGYTNEMEECVGKFYLSVKKTSIFYKQVENSLKEYFTRFKKGKEVANFELTDASRNIITLDKYKGKVVLINFTINGCPGSEKMAEALSELRNQFLADTNLVFVSVFTDKDDNWKAGIGSYSLRDAVQLGTNGEGSNHPIARYFNINGGPYLLLLNHERKIIQYPAPDPRFDKGARLIKLIRQAISDIHKTLCQYRTDEVKDFNIDGKLNGVRDGTKIELRKVMKGTISTEVVAQSETLNGEFILQGTINDTPDFYFLHVEGADQQCAIFLDNSRVQIDGDFKDWPNVEIKGSVSHEQWNQYLKTVNSKIVPLQTKLDSLKIKQSQVKYFDFPTASLITREINKININDSAVNLVIEYIESNPNSFVAPVLICDFRRSLTREKVIGLYSNLSTDVKKSNFGREVEKIINKNNNASNYTASIGSNCPDFRFSNPNGEPISLRSIVRKNKITLIDFWASWCGPCREENQILVKLYNQLHNKGFDIVGISLDNNKEKWVDAIKKDKLNWHHASELKGWNSSIIKSFNIGSLPTGILVDSQQRIISIGESVEMISKRVKNILKVYPLEDSLRGSITKEREWWDVLRYDLNITPNLSTKSINGTNIITFTYKENRNGIMQIDLQYPLIIDNATMDGKTLPFYRKNGFFNVWFINVGVLKESDQKRAIKQLIIQYHGKPKEAINPPWQGGLVWAKDNKNRPWIGVACQHLGASVWYPCKDHQSDKPNNGASLTMTVPDSLVVISNGKLVNKMVNHDKTIAWKWEVNNPISNYNITFYIGKYLNWNTDLDGLNGRLACNYWVLDYNIPKSKKQFDQVPTVIKFFESWYGGYPFYSDGYKLCESPYSGMEHQSAIAYGSSFSNGYQTPVGVIDISGSGWGLNWDYMLVHESAHEWFGNNVTTNDIADMWVHEGFASYSEVLYTEYLYGKDAANSYLKGIKKKIENKMPIIAAYGVNERADEDIYFKGSIIINTIRQVINNDSLFRNILSGINKQFQYKAIDSKDLERYFSDKSSLNLSKIFDQYLRTTQIPELQYTLESNHLLYRWSNCVKGFNMRVKIPNTNKWLYPTTKWKSCDQYKDVSSFNRLSTNGDFYITVKRI